MLLAVCENPTNEGTERLNRAFEACWLKTAKGSIPKSLREVHGGATVFIPANTWISMTNIGSESIHFVFIFSAPGFEEYMLAESVREREKNIPLSEAEDEEIMRKHAHAVIYK